MLVTEKIKVFLVDDDNVYTHALKKSLMKEKINFEIELFKSGEECINNFKKEPHIIILDYHLSAKTTDLNGIQVLKKTKLKLPETLVIMLSSQESIKIALETIKYGAYDYVIKSESSFIKIKNLIKNISEELFFVKKVEQDFSKTKKISLIVFILSIITLIIIRIIQKGGIS